MTLSIPKEFLYSAYQLLALHRAPDGSSKQIRGTCFYVRAGTELFLVTNKHNLFLSFANAKYVGYKLDGVRVVGYFGIDQYAECDFVGQTFTFAIPLNESEDVAVLNLTNVPFQFARKRKIDENPAHKTTQLSPINIDIGMAATVQDLKELNPGSAVAFPSYPELFDANGIRPLMRMGTIASDPENDYQALGEEPARRIVFEAHFTQGSSGGPVFGVKQKELVLIGINAGHLTAADPRIGTIHSGLSYCFKAACILEAIERMSKRA